MGASTTRLVGDAQSQVSPACVHSACVWRKRALPWWHLKPWKCCIDYRNYRTRRNSRSTGKFCIFPRADREGNAKGEMRPARLHELLPHFSPRTVRPRCRARSVRRHLGESSVPRTLDTEPPEAASCRASANCVVFARWRARTVPFRYGVHFFRYRADHGTKPCARGCRAQSGRAQRVWSLSQIAGW